MTKMELARSVYQISHLTGDFLLRSGQRSHEYFDKYRFESDPRLLKAIADAMVPLIPKGTEVLAGLELGGVPVATALSLQTGLPAVFVRKTAKEYGTCKVAEGAEIAGRNVLVIEDVITTGGQVILSSEDLKKLGANVQNVLCVLLREAKATDILRGKGLALQALLTREDFANL
jgi:orotate phosphoribosyltransferase